MTAVRPYDHPHDYERISEFLVDSYVSEPHLITWLQPRWEYMHAHPSIDGLPLQLMGVAEEAGTIVGVVHFEHNPAFAYVQIHPGHGSIRSSLVDWAEGNLGGFSNSLGRQILGIYVNSEDVELAELLEGRGFAAHPDFDEDHALIQPASPPEVKALAAGYRLASLEDDNDLGKINRVLWRGFGHEGEPPAAEIPGRARVQAAPSFRKDLTMVAIAPDGSYASYAGMWHDTTNRVAYVEPVATDPDHRRRGLAAACVVEGLRRVAHDGATVAWVGSGQDFYATIGFEVVNSARLWIRDLW